MVTDFTFKNAYASQRSIYDERYEAGHYDRRSAVHVLTAERDALRHAIDRALESNRRVRRISLFDFGYGTGRVTNRIHRVVCQPLLGIRQGSVGRRL